MDKSEYYPEFVGDLQGESEKAYRKVAKRHPVRERKYWEGQIAQFISSVKFRFKMLFYKSPF